MGEAAPKVITTNGDKWPVRAMLAARKIIERSLNVGGVRDYIYAINPSPYGRTSGPTR
jgi:hypothetical protein